MNYLSDFKSEKDFNEFVKNRLKFIRTNRKLTQAKVAEIMNMSEQNYARIERGNYRASMYFLFLFCSKFDITIGQFFNFKSSNNKIDNFFSQLFLKDKENLVEFSNFINDYYSN